MADLRVELHPWQTPNFVIAKSEPRPRDEGWAEGPKWPLHLVDADVLASMCDAFRAEIFQKAGKPDPAQTMGEPETAGAVDREGQ
jgi:hypothetical protein